VQEEDKPHTLVYDNEHQLQGAGQKPYTLDKHFPKPKEKQTNKTETEIAFHKFQWGKKLLINIAYAICCIRINPLEIFPKQKISHPHFLLWGLHQLQHH